MRKRVSRHSSVVAFNPLLAFSKVDPVVLPDDAIEIFTDGSCQRRNGGWSFVVYRGTEEQHSASGGESNTTNNRMEIAAVIAALIWLDARQAAILWTDSQYVVRGVIEWQHGWRKEMWRRPGNTAVANSDLWQVLYDLLATHVVDVRWVRGHADTAGNIRADELASAGRVRAAKGAQ